MDNRRKLSNYFPEPKFQLRLLGLLCGATTIQIMLTCGILFYFLEQNYLLLIKYADLEPEVSTVLVGELRMLVLTIAVTFLLFLLVTVLIGTVYSHRVAGAMYALKRTIQQIMDGKDTNLSFRHRDEFREIADYFNSMVRYLKRSHTGSAPTTTEVNPRK